MRTIGMIGPMSPWTSGGVGVHVREMAAAMAKRHYVKAVTPGPASGRHHAPNLDVFVSREFPVRPLPPFEFLPELMTSLLRLRDVDLLHQHDPRLFLAARLLRKPLVTTFHGYLTLEAIANTGTKPGRPLYRFYDSVVRAAVEASTEIVAVDHRIASWLRQVYSAQDVTVVPNGVDAERFRPGLPGQKIRREWGISSDAPLLLAAKHFVPKNGLEVVVRALPHILPERPDARLVLAGRGALEGALRNTVAELHLESYVVMPGQLPHPRMPEALSACDVCVIPSIPVAGVEEATSILALEAMACARSVVASAIGGLREILDDGVTGMLVKPGDPKALAGVVLSLLRDPERRETMGRRAREFVEARHSWTAIAQLTEAVYARALGSDPS